MGFSPKGMNLLREFLRVTRSSNDRNRRKSASFTDFSCNKMDDAPLVEMHEVHL